MKLIAFGFLTGLIPFNGCHNTYPLPREIIILPDISSSIDPDSVRQSLSAVRDAATHLQRGDSLTIIPITGDAETDLQGRTLRYEIPPSERRAAYDGDLRKIAAQIDGDIARLTIESTSHPGKHTDIIGSLRVAFKSFSPAETDKQLIILSDFVEDDPEYHFDSDSRLTNAQDNMELADKVSKEMEAHTSVDIVMGRIRSTEFGKLSVGRRRAIDSFWEELFNPVTIAPDGIFALHRALLNNQSSR